MKKIFTLACFLILFMNNTEYAIAASVKTEPSVTATWIAFLPVILFILFSTAGLIGIKKDKIKLSGMLAEKDTDAVKATALGSETPPASVSRFIVFLTGLTALILSVCLSTFYMYEYFSDPSVPVNLSNLSAVIFSLGIGVIPYGFNKISSGIK